MDYRGGMNLIIVAVSCPSGWCRSWPGLDLLRSRRWWASSSPPHLLRRGGRPGDELLLQRAQRAQAHHGGHGLAPWDGACLPRRPAPAGRATSSWTAAGRTPTVGDPLRVLPGAVRVGARTHHAVSSPRYEIRRAVVEYGRRRPPPRRCASSARAIAPLVQNSARKSALTEQRQRRGRGIPHTPGWSAERWDPVVGRRHVLRPGQRQIFPVGAVVGQGVQPVPHHPFQGGVHEFGKGARPSAVRSTS
ncbi:hypothetical protein QJS66_15745 [Kocuria rhizophila]|nr:hypothetical protein QJS66_15745 [Kocuria rhizophila]